MRNLPKARARLWVSAGWCWIAKSSLGPAGSMPKRFQGRTSPDDVVLVRAFRTRDYRVAPEEFCLRGRPPKGSVYT